MIRRTRIVLIEDDPATAQMYKFQLVLDGFEPAIAGDGETGLSMAREDRPDLILLDIRLPRQSGFEILATLKGDPDLRSIPVVILTNYGEPDQIARAMRTGACDYLVKSRVKPSELSRRIPIWILAERSTMGSTSGMYSHLGRLGDGG